MRYIVFPSYSYKNYSRPQLEDTIRESEIEIVSGPTESGLYIIEGEILIVEILKLVTHPFYVIMEDFDLPTIH